MLQPAENCVSDCFSTWVSETVEKVNKSTVASNIGKFPLLNLKLSNFIILLFSYGEQAMGLAEDWLKTGLLFILLSDLSTDHNLEDGLNVSFLKSEIELIESSGKLKLKVEWTLWALPQHQFELLLKHQLDVIVRLEVCVQELFLLYLYWLELKN